MNILRSYVKKQKCFLLVLCIACTLMITPFLMKTEMSTVSTSQKLKLNVTVEDDAGLKIIFAEKNNERHGNNITYLGISDVAIDIDGTTWELEDAVNEGQISSEEMIAYARLDVNNGFCEEKWESQNSLAKFTYRYLEYDIVYIYDVYETPNGKQHVISELAVCAPGRSPSFFYVDEETGKPIDYEDWGLKFDVVEANDAEVILKCTQIGGQQIGKLYVEYFDLYRKNVEDGTEEYIEPLVNDFLGELNINCDIAMNGVSDIILDLSKKYGDLVAGEYVVYLSVKDRYSESDKHPLMRNYYDRQRFAISFTVCP